MNPLKNFAAAVATLLIASLSPGQASAQEQTNQSRISRHRLPQTDGNYRGTRTFVEDEPVPEYTWASEKAYEDFNDLKFGVRIHWGLYSIIHQSKESWPFLKMTNAEKQSYQANAKTWNPQGFNAEEWMQFFSESGLRMFAFTTKHHEGFSMFDTKTRVKKRVNWTAPGGPAIEDCDVAFSIMESPFKRDIVKELCDAAHRNNIKIDLYFSHTDWYDADFRPYGSHPLQVPSFRELTGKPKNEVQEAKDREKHFGKIVPTVVPDPTPEEVGRMMKRHRAQLTELLTNYGKIDMICLDIKFGPSVWPQLRETMLELRKLQPDVMFRARGIGNYGDYYTPEGFVPGSKENTRVPWFVIYPLGSSFSYEAEATQHKGAQWIIKNLVDCAAKGGNFMVGIGPDENGRFHPTAIAQLKQVGQWLKANGEGIYATRARDGDLWKESDSIKFTRSKDNKTIYAHCGEWPGQQLILRTVKPKANSPIRLLGTDGALDWKHEPGKGLITTPRQVLATIPEAQRLAFTFRIETE
jgi:alpha-L-fucosidase